MSEDLVHWRDLPYALYPGPEEECFSGNVLVEADRAIALYHGRKLGNITAIASDPLLLNWEKKYKEGYISIGIGQSVDKAFAGTKGEAGLTNISVGETAIEKRKTTRRTNDAARCSAAKNGST